MLAQVKNIPGVTINDLYQQYPEFDIDVEKEQQLLLQHDIIVWQHPLYWYSAPALLKQWQDLVLEHTWAYGKNASALQGKRIFNAITSGGRKDAYQQQGLNHCTIFELLRPFERTAELCRMHYWPPFWVPGTHRMDIAEIHQYSLLYKEIIIALQKEQWSEQEILDAGFLNDMVSTKELFNQTPSS